MRIDIAKTDSMKQQNAQFVTKMCPSFHPQLRLWHIWYNKKKEKAEHKASWMELKGTHIISYHIINRVI